MSVQGSQKMRKSSTVSVSKQGPLKAILSVSSLMRKEPHFKKSKSNSPTSLLQLHSSPDGSFSGHRSPGSISYKGLKCKSPNYRSEWLGGYIRRTASLDAIYLKGQWPKDVIAMHSVILKINKSTQTDDSGNDKKCRYSEVTNEDVKYEKYIRHRLQKVNKETQSSPKLGLRLVSPSIQNEYGLSGSQTPPGSVLPNLIRSGPQSPIQGYPINITMKTSLGRTLMRNSIEGLNQEIERIVLRDIDDRFFNCSSIPEGHKAPLADILRQTRSVNTQTPGNDEFESDIGTSGPPSRDSGSPIVSGSVGTCTPSYYQGSCGSSPDDFNKFGTSPHINKFLAREPPDGCEKVNLKLEESVRQRNEWGNVGFIPLKPMSTAFQLKPSLGSAFHPLHSNHSGIYCSTPHAEEPKSTDCNYENVGEYTEDCSKRTINEEDISPMTKN